ncbi:MAG: ROK family protein, partial [Gemmataceae bacterium]
MSTGYWLGVDLGGTKILSGLFDDDLKLLARSKNPTSAEGGPAGVFGRIAQGVEAVLREANVDPALVRGMGMG